MATLGPMAAPAADSAAPVAPSATGMPATAELVYRTSATVRLAGMPMSLHARTTTHWHTSGNQYEMSFHTDTVDFTQSSSGRLDDDGALLPARYDEKRPFHDVESVFIDWAHGSIRFGSAAPVAAPEAGTQDRASLQFELVRLLQRHPERMLPGSSYAVKLIGPHDIDPWTFLVSEEAAVETGRGPLRATRFSARRMAGGVEETMDVWLSESVRWMPIRIRIVDRKQSIIDSVLQQAQFP